MNSRASQSVFFVLLLVCLTLPALSQDSPEWKISSVDEPLRLNHTSVNTTTFQFFKLEYADNDENDEWYDLGRDEINLTENQNNISFDYNQTGNFAASKMYLDNGYWAAIIQPNKQQENITFRAQGETKDGVGSNGEENLTQYFNEGDLNISINTDADKASVKGVELPYLYAKAGSQISVEATVQNSTSGEFLDENSGDVSVVISDLSNSGNVTELFSKDDENFFFNDRVEVPTETNKTFVMHVNVSNSTSPSAKGSYTTLLSTYPAIEGEVTEFSPTSDSIGGCNDKASNCDPETELEVDYDITAASAEGVNITVYAFNESGRHQIYNESLEGVSNNEDEFTGKVNVTDLNTSKYQNKIEYKFEAYNDKRTHVDRKNVTIDPFEINSPALDAYTGENYDVQIELRKMHSLDEYNKSRFDEVQVNVTNSSGEVVESYTISDLVYNEGTGVMEETILIEDDAEGPYNLEVEATDIYNHTRSNEFSFSIKDVDQTFSITDSTFDVETLWDQNFTVDISNDRDTSRDLEIADDLPEEITLNNNSISLSGDEEDFLDFTVNLTDFEEETGELTLSDNSSVYNKTVDITAEPINCEVISGDLCSMTSDWINVSVSDSVGTEIRDIEVANIGAIGSEINYNMSITGDISSYAQVVGDSTDLNMTNSHTKQVNYTATESGNFTGQIVFDTESGDTISLNTSLEANNISSDEGSDTSEPSGSISVTPEDVDLDTFPSGESRTETMELENNLESSISEVDVDSITYDVSVSEFDEVSAGETEEFTLNFEEVESESGTVAISAGGAETSVSVSADPVDDYSQMADNGLRNRKNNLQEQTSDTSLQEDLTGVSTKISKIQSAWDSGDYERARTLYDEADSTLTDVSNQINTGGEDTGGTDEESSGGVPILPIAGIIVLLLAVSFVALTSYVPEEGDPLYGVLGE